MFTTFVQPTLAVVSSSQLDQSSEPGIAKRHRRIVHGRQGDKLSQLQVYIQQLATTQVILTPLSVRSHAMEIVKMRRISLHPFTHRAGCPSMKFGLPKKADMRCAQ